MKENDLKTVMVFGTFDYLHAGHENLFLQAREHGSHITAIIARDKTVRTIKGETPHHNEKERLKNLQDTGWANQVILGNHKDKIKVIRTYKPDVIGLGYDQFAFTYSLEKLIIDLNMDTKIIRLKPYRPDMYKSSILKAEIKRIDNEKEVLYNQMQEK